MIVGIPTGTERWRGTELAGILRSSDTTNENGTTDEVKSQS